MVERPTHPAAHARTREDHATEVAEDYVEAVAELIDRHGVCRVTDLASRFGVSHVTVVRRVKRLAAEGLLNTRPYQPIGITQAGRDLAEACRRRHDIVYRFLLAIGVPEDVASIDSEGIGHHVSQVTLECLRRVAEGG